MQMHLAEDKQQLVWRAFLDLSKAADTVCRPLLRQMLRS